MTESAYAGSKNDLPNLRGFQWPCNSITLPMASTILANIFRPDLQVLGDQPTASITDVMHLSSYNWIEAPTSTIAVPGCPPLWSNAKGPRQVKKDTGLVYIDQNRARHPNSPLEPIFRALRISDPLFDIRSIDVVTDRNNLRKLFSFISSSSKKSGNKGFTIDVEIVRNTALFGRMETANHEIIPASQNRGYGHEFEKACTIDQISGSTGHHRIVSYRFGDLSCIIRHETDGYVATEDTAPSWVDDEPEKDTLSNMLESLTISSTSSSAQATCIGSTLTIRQEGQVIPRESTLEIKTRASHRPFDYNEIAPQLWFSQTPKLVRAYHSYGRFQKVVVEDVATEVQKWGDEHRADLMRLAGLIKKIVTVVKDSDGKAVVTYDGKSDVLVLRKSSGKKMLPEELYAKWNDTD